MLKILSIKPNYIFVLLILFSVGAAGYEGLSSSDDGTFILAGGSWFEFSTKNPSIDWTLLYRWSNESVDWEPFLTTGNIIKDVQISPSGTYISVIDIILQENSESYPKQSLKLYTNKKELIATFPEIYDIVFSPDESSIALIVGEYREGPYMPKEIIIYDIEAKSEYHLDHQANEIVWAPHDKRLYFKWNGNFPSYYFDSNTDKVIQTEHKGINFSSDGKYYLNEYDKNIYLTQDNTCVYDSTKADEYPKEPYTAFWSSYDEVVFVYSPMRKNKEGVFPAYYGVEVFNLTTGYLCRFPIYFPIGINRKTKQLIYLNEGKVRYLDTMDIISDAENSKSCTHIPTK